MASKDKKSVYVVLSTEEQANTADGGGNNSSKRMVTSLGKLIKSESTDTELTVRLQKPFYDQRKITVPSSRVIAYLNNPSKGVAFGHDLSALYREQKDDLHYFCKPPTDKVHRELQGGLDKIKKLLQQHNLWKTRVAELPIYYKIVANKSKYAGMFKPTPENDSAEITVYVGDDGQLLDDPAYVWAHEIGHALHYFYLRTHSVLEARWTSLYLDSIAGEVYDTKMIRALWKALIAHETTGAWQSSYDEDSPERVACKAVLAYLKQAHKCSPKDVTALLQGGRDDERAIERLKALWPTEAIHGHRIAPLITEYACVSIKECLAESVAHYLLGRKLPKRVTALVETTLVACQSA